MKKLLSNYKFIVQQLHLQKSTPTGEMDTCYLQSNATKKALFLPNIKEILKKIEKLDNIF